MIATLVFATIFASLLLTQNAYSFVASFHGTFRPSFVRLEKRLDKLKNFPRLTSQFSSTGSIHHSMPAAVIISHHCNHKYVGLLRDMATASILGTMSDFVAQWIDSNSLQEKNKSKYPDNVTQTPSNHHPHVIPFDIKRSMRFLIFGFFDGAIGHTWFYSLDRVIQGQRWSDIVLRVALDTVVYTPLWSVWFLTLMTFLEKKTWKGLRYIIANEWWPLCRLSSLFFFPISLALYTVIPLKWRVFASGMTTMLCTIAVSLWNAARHSKMKK